MIPRQAVQRSAVRYPGGVRLVSRRRAYGAHGKRGDRARITRWTRRSAFSNTLFLLRLLYGKLPGTVWAVTLTVRDDPGPADWQACRRRLTNWLAKHDTITHWYWSTEWQRRGVPHLHLLICTDQWTDIPDLMNAWQGRFAAAYRPGPLGQQCRQVDSAAEWAKYLSKHTARGISNYQRQTPPAWQGQPVGRLWGCSRNFPLSLGDVYDLDEPRWFSMRRALRSFRQAEHRHQNRRRPECSRLRFPARRDSGITCWLREAAQEALCRDLCPVIKVWPSQTPTGPPKVTSGPLGRPEARSQAIEALQLRTPAR